ncbi:hypothetical protein L1887_59214 [Cichorium endivia]|nr:hypothetical protein L1887_59214 [Cichorium endivia]
MLSRLLGQRRLVSGGLATRVKGGTPYERRCCGRIRLCGTSVQANCSRCGSARRGETEPFYAGKASEGMAAMLSDRCEWEPLQTNDAARAAGGYEPNDCCEVLVETPRSTRLKVQHALCPLLVHDTVAALSASDGLPRADLVGGGAVGADVLHDRVASGETAHARAAARCRSGRSCLVRHYKLDPRGLWRQEVDDCEKVQSGELRIFLSLLTAAQSIATLGISRDVSGRLEVLDSTLAPSHGQPH